MPPIPIYAHSPINAAAKADGVTPKTAEKGPDTSFPAPPPTTTTQSGAYPAAQPGAPAMPAPTGASSMQQQYAPPQPTRTQPLETQGPPPPQANAFPSPFTASPPQAAATGLPPPPRAGEAAQQPQAFYPSQTTYPSQMSIPAPPAAMSQSAQRGTTIAFGQAPLASEHPQGYQQNPNAGELDRYQRAAQEALERDEQAARRPSFSDGGADGVWGSVKGAMAAAGEKIAAAEEEVWKRINKD